MAVVAGIVFFAIRALLALVPALTVSFPIKKWSAAGALLIQHHGGELTALYGGKIGALFRVVVPIDPTDTPGTNRSHDLETK